MIRRKIALILICTAGVSACSPKLSDLAAYTAQVKQNTRVSIEPYPEFEQQPPFIYAAQDLRSPFTRPKNNTAQLQVEQQANCTQPDFDRRKEPLENYGLDALSLAGSFTAGGTRWILVKTNDGALHKAKIGSRIGLFNGEITAIASQAVKIQQLLPDGAGCWQSKETTLTMSSAAGESKNV